MIGKALLAGGAALACVGCGGITVTKLSASDPAVADRVGVPYNLGMTRYEIKITRRVTQCGNAATVVVQAETKAARVVDPQQMYVLNADGWMETSDIASGFDANGITTALNAQSEDRTAQVISNAIGTAVQIAGLVAAGAGPAAEVCVQDVADALKKVPALKKKADAATAALEAANKQVETYTNQAVARGANVDATTKAKLSLAISNQAKAQAAQDAANKSLQDVLDKTSYTVTVNWPVDGNTFRQDCDASFDPQCPLPDGRLISWSSVDLHAVSMHDASEKLAALKRQMDVYFAIEPLDPVARSTSGTDTADLTKGIPVRFAAAGRLRVCTIAPCGAPGSKQVAQSADTILQLGRLYTVPLPTGAFEAGNVEIDTGDNGAPKKVESKASAAAAEALTGSVKDVATQGASIDKTLRGAALAKLKADTDKLQAMKANLDAQAAVSDTAKQTAGYQAQAALYNAEKAALQAEHDLAAAQAALQQ